MNTIDLRNVCLTLGRRPILSDVTMAIGPREFIGVLGPNGAGKTTLMRAILGLVAPAAGQIEVFGKPARPGRAAIGYMPQSRPALGGVNLTGWDVVASAADSQRFGLPLLSRAASRDVAWALDQVDATALARRRMPEMSGGERQRLLLAQALMSRPRLLLLDEPLISLDLQHQQTVVALVRRLQQDLGLTVLFSAHELNPLFDAVDRVLYLGAGQAALGTVDEVITGPVLSKLYGLPIEVVRINQRIFVVPEKRPEDSPLLQNRNKKLMPAA